MIKQIVESNVFGFHTFSHFLDYKSFVSSAEEYIVSNFAESTSTKGFYSLEKDEVVSLISRSDLQVASDYH